MKDNDNKLIIICAILIILIAITLGIDYISLLYIIIGISLMWWGLKQITGNQKNPYEMDIGTGEAEDDINIDGDNYRPQRKPISQNVKDKVWNRDGGKCVQCGSNEDLEFDHIIPHSKGGADTYRNLQLLCEPCNRSKSAKIG